MITGRSRMDTITIKIFIEDRIRWHFFEYSVQIT